MTERPIQRRCPVKEFTGLLKNPCQPWVEGRNMSGPNDPFGSRALEEALAGQRALASMLDAQRRLVADFLRPNALEEALEDRRRIEEAMGGRGMVEEALRQRRMMEEALGGRNLAEEALEQRRMVGGSARTAWARGGSSRAAAASEIVRVERRSGMVEHTTAPTSSQTLTGAEARFCNELRLPTSFIC